jgi:hypothetical protein
MQRHHPHSRYRLLELTHLSRRLPRPRRSTCLLTALPSGNALSLALVHCLAAELPDVRFVLYERDDVDAVWLCGYGVRAARFVRHLRARHPSAVIVVTGGAPAGAWRHEVIEAGADHACSWPVDYGLLGSILRGASPSVVTERAWHSLPSQG